MNDSEAIIISGHSFQSFGAIFICRLSTEEDLQERLLVFPAFSRGNDSINCVYCGKFPVISWMLLGFNSQFELLNRRSAKNSGIKCSIYFPLLFSRLKNDISRSQVNDVH